MLAWWVTPALEGAFGREAPLPLQEELHTFTTALFTD